MIAFSLTLEFSFQDRSSDLSMVTRFARRQAKPVSERDLIKELQQVKNENFQLKLRIHHLEDSQGLKDRMGTEENVYRINVDLRVDKEMLENQIAEKNNCLRDALTAIEDYEKEKIQRLEDIDELRREMEELR